MQNAFNALPELIHSTSLETFRMIFVETEELRDLHGTYRLVILIHRMP